MLDFKVLEYRPSDKMVVADPTLRNEIAQQGVRELMRKTGLSQHTIEAIRAGQPVRHTTLKLHQNRAKKGGGTLLVLLSPIPPSR